MTDLLPDLGELDGVTPARQERSRVAQERLLQAAEAVFAAKGYHRAHITEISAAAGYSIGTFYLRFRDKDAVFRALRRRFTARAHTNIDRFFDLPRWSEETPTQLIDAYVRATARIMGANTGFFRALYQRSLDSEATEDWRELRAATQQAGRRLAGFLRERAPSLDRPDFERLCVFSLGAVEGAIIHHLLNRVMGDDLEGGFFLRSLTHMTTASLGLPPADPNPAH